MSNVIIPDIIRNTPIQEQKTLDINLHKNYDNRKNYYNINQSWNTNTTINKNHEGFIMFIIKLIILPFNLSYSIGNYFIKKYDLKNKWNLERKKHKIWKKMNNYIKKKNNYYIDDEIL